MMSKHLKRLMTGSVRKLAEHHRRLRLEPLESRTVLSATLSALPSLAVDSLLAGPWPGPVFRVVAPAPIEAVRRFALEMGPQPAGDGHAVAPGLGAASPQSLGSAAPSIQETALGPWPLVQRPSSLPTAGRLAEAGSPGDAAILGSATADSGRFFTQPSFTNGLLQNAATTGDLSSLRSLTLYAISDANTLGRIRDGFVQQRSESVINSLGQDRGILDRTLVFDGNNLVFGKPVHTLPPWAPPSPVEHAGAFRSVVVPRGVVSQELTSLANTLASTSGAFEQDSKTAAAAHDRNWLAADRLEKSGFVALPSADYVDALEAMTASPALGGRELGTSSAYADTAESTNNGADLGAGLEEALPGFTSPLAAAGASTADSLDEGGYVRINTSKTSKTSPATDRYSVLDYVWRESASESGYDRPVEGSQASGKGSRVSSGAVRRFARAIDSDEEGMIQLAAASPAACAICVPAAALASDAGSSIATKSICMDEGLGLFQAFELASAPAGDAEQAISTADAAHPAGTAVSTSAADSRGLEESASIDNGLEQPPAQHAATALGIVIASAFTVLQDRRKRESAAARIDRMEFSQRMVRIDRIS